MDTIVGQMDGHSAIQIGQNLQNDFAANGSLSLQYGSMRTTNPYDVTAGCRPDQFRCDNGQCVSITYLCDFTTQCDDGTDENKCAYPKCESGQFTCDNGQCIANHRRCDLISDCLDNSDEISCDESLIGFQCFDGTWLPAHAYCDGQRDCSGKNWEDEPIECGMLT
ncbi:CD320 antigen-like [Amphiura filiformis]|uniref:CD320 antigen-like n=1 Tax=Amphiura filiformis TaxID=82378 RepID=UPI003B21DEFE